MISGFPGGMSTVHPDLLYRKRHTASWTSTHPPNLMHSPVHGLPPTYMDSNLPAMELARIMVRAGCAFLVCLLVCNPHWAFIR